MKRIAPRIRWWAAMGVVAAIGLASVLTVNAVWRGDDSDETTQPVATANIPPDVLAEVIAPSPTASPTAGCQEDEVLAGEGDFSAGGQWSKGWRCVPLDDLIEDRLETLDQTTKRPATLVAVERQLRQALKAIEQLHKMIEEILKDW